MSIAHPIIISGDRGLSQRPTWREADICLGLVLAKDGGRRRRNRAAAGEARLGLGFVEKAELRWAKLDSETRTSAVVKSAGSGSTGVGSDSSASSGGSATTWAANVKQEGEAESARVDGKSRGCEACGNPEMERGCNGEGRIMGGIGSIPGFGWWPIKAYRPCPSFVRSGGRYRRSGQSLDEIAFGRKGANDDLDVSERLNTK